MRSSEAGDAYDRLVELLESAEADYRLIDHEPEGRTEVVSGFRGHDVSQAAKCVIVMVKLGKKNKQFVLAVVPGDRRVDLDGIKRLYDGTYVSFASRDIAERLAGSVSGTILPFALDPSLDLIVDPGLFESEEIYFNAARLDRSVALNSKDYAALARPRIERIAMEAGNA
ncbi:YbaK/EbsC family protein [Flindersiella endophytica]